jgi:hypothetical protein
MPSHWKIRCVRADSGFFAQGLLGFLEQGALPYLEVKKEKAMLGQQMHRLTEELCKIDAALRKSKKKETDAGKVERRSGRLACS